MTIHDNRYQQYVKILREELVPAMGCTEPIAIAYAAALVRHTLGALPDRVTVEVSGNIIKNVKSVVVPHTGGLRGIASAVAAGVVAGDEEKELEVISRVTEEEIAAIRDYAAHAEIHVRHASTPHIFDIMITASRGAESAFVRIAQHHTNVVCIRRGEEILLEKEIAREENGLTDRSTMNIESIIEFADCVEIPDVEAVLNRQIAYNMAIAEEGLRNPYGANIGKTLLRNHGGDLFYKMRAYAAAASDARMNGCELPVIINSGSGNQGITTSVPVIVYARTQRMTQEELLRALCVSNLVTAHLKTGIGRLSAYCGAVSAGCGAAAGIAYLMGGRYDMIAHTVVNALAMCSGIVCDGAKASCAAKISSAIDAGLLGLEMYQSGDQFYGGEGLVKKGVENTISVIGDLASKGMSETDREIIRLMMD
ncbi:MAG: serine dehydratase subunit alpha family protein [Ruminococcaceae bacterium]|nr:serine dehydratase subunit alpha family protein [Oscillospiraceae bacterium]